MSGEIVPTSGSTVVGVVILTRHGDRLGYYQDPHSYSASGTSITPLGSLQTYQSGIQLRDRYLRNDSANAIAGVDYPKINLNEVDFVADAAEGQVIVDSAYSFAQGFFPINREAGSTKLANGTTVTSPLDGYIYTPITTVEPAEDISLEGFTSCPAFTEHAKAAYKTPSFLKVEEEYKGYLESLPPLLDGREVSLANFYNVFDFMNVQNIHNETFRNIVSENGTNDYIMRTARHLANYHESRVFTDEDIDGIGNIAGQTILPPIIQSLQSMATSDGSGPLKVRYIGVAYKPFLSLFNMTESSEADNGMVSYASVVAIELRKRGDDFTVQWNFRNGSAVTDDGLENPLTTMTLFKGQDTEIPLQTFIDKMEPHAVSSLETWCSRCHNTDTRGCDLINQLHELGGGNNAQYADITSTTGKQHVSPVVAGVIGAMVTLVVCGFLFGGLGFWFGKKSGAKAKKRQHEAVFEKASEADD